MNDISLYENQKIASGHSLAQGIEDCTCWPRQVLSPALLKGKKTYEFRWLSVHVIVQERSGSNSMGI